MDIHLAGWSETRSAAALGLSTGRQKRYGESCAAHTPCVTRDGLLRGHTHTLTNAHAHTLTYSQR
eukprot:9047488-Pyramimonas_sp.AAC.1